MAGAATSVDVGEITGELVRQVAREGRRRSIGPRAGRALELLGHAIDYLTDEYLHEAERLSVTDPQVEAICLLMALNREIYYECPVAPRFAERLRLFFGVKKG